MQRSSLFPITFVCATVIIVTAMLARGGGLNPPAGPVSSTMHTIEDVYQEVASLPDFLPVGGGVWEAKAAIDLDFSQPEVLLSGSGQLHAVLISTHPTSIVTSSGFILTIDGQSLGRLSTVGASHKVILDIRYDSEVTLQRNGEGVDVILLYRPDPES